MGLFDNARTPHEQRLHAAAVDGDVAEIEHALREWRADGSVSPPEAFDLRLAAGIAVSHSRPAALRYLLEQDVIPTNTLARQAAAAEGTECFDVLYEHGWRPETEPDEDTMPTVQMVLNKDDKLHWLLDHNADTNVPCTRTNDTPLSRAARVSSIETVDLLRQHGAKLEGSNALQQAASRKGPDDRALAMMQHLVDVGADVNAVEVTHGKPTGYSSRDYGTVLHAAIGSGKPERVRWVLEHGADGKIMNTKGYSPLQWAEECESGSEVVGMLREAGCE